MSTNQVRTLPIAYIHNASYLGGLAGLIIALVALRRAKRLGKEEKRLGV